MLNILLPILFFLSLSGIIYMFLRKMPVIAHIPLESIQNRETFFAFLQRKFKSFFSHIHPKKIKIHFLVFLDRVLLRFKTSSLNLYKSIEELSKDVNKKSQQEKWEHNWFSHKEKKDPKVKKEK
jgi:hypothetical protein